MEIDPSRQTFIPPSTGQQVQRPAVDQSTQAAPTANTSANTFSEILSSLEQELQTQGSAQALYGASTRYVQSVTQALMTLLDELNLLLHVNPPERPPLLGLDDPLAEFKQLLPESDQEPSKTPGRIGNGTKAAADLEAHGNTPSSVSTTPKHQASGSWSSQPAPHDAPNDAQPSGEATSPAALPESRGPQQALTSASREAVAGSPLKPGMDFSSAPGKPASSAGTDAERLQTRQVLPKEAPREAATLQSLIPFTDLASEAAHDPSTRQQLTAVRDILKTLFPQQVRDSRADDITLIRTLLNSLPDELLATLLNATSKEPSSHDPSATRLTDGSLSKREAKGDPQQATFGPKERTLASQIQKSPTSHEATAYSTSSSSPSPNSSPKKELGTPNAALTQSSNDAAAAQTRVPNRSLAMLAQDPALLAALHSAALKRTYTELRPQKQLLKRRPPQRPRAEDERSQPDRGETANDAERESLGLALLRAMLRDRPRPGI